MLLAKSRPIVVICMADGSHFARERLIAFTPWHLDAVSGSHPPHLLCSGLRTQVGHRVMSEKCQTRKWRIQATQRKAARRRLFNSNPMIVDQAAINAGF